MPFSAVGAGKESCMKPTKLQKKTAKAAFGCLLLLLLYGCASDRMTTSGEQGAENDVALTDGHVWELADTDLTEAANADDPPQLSAADGKEDSRQTSGSRRLAVYVCGAVKHPGVYELAEGSRVYEALELAGGVTADASPTAVNQAQLLTDGEMIEILTVSEAAEQETVQAAASDGKVNINTADADELKTLPGIGDAKADSIIAYREQNGAFAAIEDIKNIEGIKDGVFAKLEDHIKVE